MAHEWKAMGLGLLALAGAFAAEAGQAEVGKIINPGFELDADRDGIPDGWTRGGQVQMRLDDKMKKEGKLSVRFESRVAAEGSVGQVVGVEPGAVYRASAWVRTRGYKAAQGSRLRAALAVRSSSGTTVVEYGEGPADAGGWVQQVMDFFAPSSGKIMLSCFFAGRRPAMGTAWFDDVQLERLAPKDGLANVAEPPHGCYVLAKWATLQNPPDWSSLTTAVDRYYRAESLRGPVPVISKYVQAVCAAAQDDPKVRPLVVRLCGHHAWRFPLSAFLKHDMRSICQEAIDRAGKNPELAALAREARRGLGRAAAVSGEGAVAEAAKTLKHIYSAPGYERARVVQILLHDARDLGHAEGKARAARLYEILMAFVDPADPQRVRVEMDRLRFLRKSGEAKEAQQAAKLLVAPERRAPSSALKDLLLGSAVLSLDSGDGEGARRWASTAEERLAKDRVAMAGFRLGYARALAHRDHWGDAAAECQRLVASLPDQAKACFEAQTLLVRSFLKQGRHDELLAAAKVLYAAAPNSEVEITKAVELVMQALKAKYRSIALANDFVAFQSHGPKGEDGKKGTDDDLKNPLAEVKWTPPPEIEALFKKTLAGLPKDFRSRRWRGYLYLYWGKPDMALGEFVRRYDEAPLEQKAVDEAINDLVVALNAYHGHTLAGEQFMAYQKFGPKGKDGKHGTPDDLDDPLKGIARAAK